jgi:hypothetical protein
MSKEDPNRAGAHLSKPDPSKTERDAAAKAVRDNMARLKALRLAREAAEPPRPAAAGKKASGKAKKKPGEKAPALSDWLSRQQSGGRRT